MLGFPAARGHLRGCSAATGPPATAASGPVRRPVARWGSPPRRCGPGVSARPGTHGVPPPGARLPEGRPEPFGRPAGPGVATPGEEPLPPGGVAARVGWCLQLPGGPGRPARAEARPAVQPGCPLSAGRAAARGSGGGVRSRPRRPARGGGRAVAVPPRGARSGWGRARLPRGGGGGVRSRSDGPRGVEFGVGRAPPGGAASPGRLCPSGGGVQPPGRPARGGGRPPQGCPLREGPAAPGVSAPGGAGCPWERPASLRRSGPGPVPVRRPGVPRAPAAVCGTAGSRPGRPSRTAGSSPGPGRRRPG